MMPKEEIDIKVNCFPIAFNPKALVQVYTLKFVPQLDVTKMRAIKRMMIWGKPQLGTIFKYYFLISGTQLLAIPVPNAATVQKFENDTKQMIYLLADSTYDPPPVPNYQIVILHTPKTITYNELLKPSSHSDYIVAHTILNQIITQALLEKKYAMLGKSSKYFNFNKPPVHLNGYEVYAGLRKALVCGQTAPIIRIDYVTRVFNNQNLLEYLIELKKQLGSPDMIKHEILQKKIMTKYGQKGRFYQIDDIDFTISPSKHKIDYQGNIVNLIDYYKARYGLIIKDGNQPLIKFITNRQKRQADQQQKMKTVNKPPQLSKEAQYDIYLVPELCYYVELPESFFENKGGERNELDDIMKPEPSSRYMKIKECMTPLKESAQFLKESGVKIGEEMMTIKGRVITPSISLRSQNEQSSQVSVRDCSFQYRGCLPICSTKVLNSNEFLILYEQEECDPENSSAKAFASELYKCACSRAFELKVPTIVPYAFNKSMKGKTEAILDAAKKNYNPSIKVIMFILPFARKGGPSKEVYSNIKRVMYRNGIVSQMVLQGTIRRNKIPINDKIFLKIMLRLGADLWKVNVRPELSIAPKLMIIGIESANQKSMAFCSTDNSRYGNFYTQILKYQENVDTQRRVLNLSSYIVKALTHFKQLNGFFPELMIFYRKGKSEEEVFTSIEKEIRETEETITKFETDNKCKMPYIFSLYNSRSSLRGFQMQNGHIINPKEAIIVEDKQIIPAKENTGLVYEFYLKPQFQTVGSANFTHFKVLHMAAGVTGENFAEFTLLQCFNFYGFYGGIRLPAVCQYARRAADKYALTSQEPNESIAGKKYAY